MRVSLVAALIAGGCVVQSEGTDKGDDTPAVGGVDLTWQVGASGCDASGVETIRVTAGEDVELEAPCADGSLSADLDEGLYDLVFTGLDDGSRPRYEGVAAAVRVLPGEVTTVPTVVLEALPATLTVTWYFDNGRLCGGNDVSDIDLTLFDDDTIVESLTTECDDGIEALPPVQAGAYTLSVLGRNADGVIQYGANRELELEKGAAVTAEVMLEPW